MTKNFPISIFVSWASNFGFLILDFRIRSSDFRSRTLDLGLRISDFGYRTSDIGPRISDFGSRTSDIGLQILDFGSRASDLRLPISEFDSPHHPPSPSSHLPSELSLSADFATYSSFAWKRKVIKTLYNPENI